MTLRRLALAAALSLTAGATLAQGLFAPAVTVDDKVITGYEMEQRQKFLALLGAPGNLRDLAQEQLVDDRLKLAAAERAGIAVSEEEVLTGMEEFAARANLKREEFVKAIEAGGISEQSFRDFIRAGVAWRTLVRLRFSRQAQAGDASVERALNAGSGSNVRVLLAEIIMPAAPEELEAVRARAEQIAQYKSEGEFAQAARQYSANASAGRGGKLPWQNLGDLPPGLAPLIIGLAPGEVTAPIPIPNAFALFQMRAIEETGFSAPEFAAIEYATYLLPGGRSEANLAAARKIARSVDTCDDLYGVAKGKPAELLERVSAEPAKIPTDIGIELFKLDKGEVSMALTRDDALMLVMLCGRTPKQIEGQSREDLTLAITNKRLNSLADGYLAELRASARIIER